MSAALTAVLAATLVACGDDDDAATESTDLVTVATSADTTEPPPPTETTVPDTTGPTTSEPSSSAADCPQEPTEESADELLVGLPEDEATEVAEACGWILRVVRRDGEDLPATRDFRPNRVNVEVTDDEVTAIVNTG